MSKKGGRAEQIWLALYVVIPLILFTPLSEFFAQEGIYRTLISGAIGLIGATAGFGVFYLTRNQQNLFRALALAGIIVLGLILLKGLQLYTNSESYFSLFTPN